MSVYARAVSCFASTTVATRHSSRGCVEVTRSGITLVSLFAPWITAIVVAELLPETWLVTVQELESAHPLRALPEVEMGDEQAPRSTMLRRQRRAVVSESDPRLPARDVGKRQVRGVATVAESEHEIPLAQTPGARCVEQGVDRHAFPSRVELRPLRDTVDVDRRHVMGKRLQLIPRPSNRPSGCVANDEVPAREW